MGLLNRVGFLRRAGMPRVEWMFMLREEEGRVEIGRDEGLLKREKDVGTVDAEQGGFCLSY